MSTQYIDGIFSKHNKVNMLELAKTTDKNVAVAVFLADSEGIVGIESMFKSRAKVGFKKYGVTTERTDLTLDQWKLHALEEAMDHTIYSVVLCELLQFKERSVDLLAASLETLKLSWEMYNDK
jgi:hypothetical protein